MRRLTAVTVCLLVVLAGCNAMPGSGGTEGATVRETHTDSTTEPGAVETAADAGETATATTAGTGAADLPPGLSESGVTDAAALAAAHEDALAGRTYTYDREVRVVAENGSELGGWSQHTQVGAERLRFNHTQTGTGVNVAGYRISDVRVYTNGSVTYSNASDYPDGYRVAPGRGFAATTFSSEQLLADVLDAAETSVTPIEPPADAAREGDSAASEDDDQWYRVRAENGSDSFTYELPNRTVEVNATNVTATAVVAPDGFVRNVTYEYDFERGTVSGRRTMSVRYSAVGGTEVEIPAWVEDAKAVHANRTRGNATRSLLRDGLVPSNALAG